MSFLKFVPVSSLALLLCVPALSASESDALTIDANLRALHMPYGGVIDPIFAAATSNTIVGYTRCGDSALWTGGYLAAESFRFAVTKDSGAWHNMSQAVDALQLLVDVTGTDVLARCAVPQNSSYAAGIASEENSNGVYHASVGGVAYQWIGHTSRDEYSGVFFGLGVAYDNAGQYALKVRIARIVTRLLNKLEHDAWLVILPDGTVSTTFLGRADQQLSFLQVGRHVNPAAFTKAYQDMRSYAAVAVIPPIALESLDYSGSYFKFNLDEMNLYNLIRLEDPGSSALKQYNQAYALVATTTDNHLNAFFQVIDRALNGPNRKRDEITRQSLQSWLQRPRRDVPVDNRGKFATCGSSDNACHPIPVINRVTTDFLWQRSPFQLVGGGQGTIEGAGIDYILPYWMGRYYGVL